MPARALTAKCIAKPWGRRDLPPIFPGLPPVQEPVGEIWFVPEDGADHELLIKYLFTSEKLSVQVHPDDVSARAQGLPRGKDEAWLIIDCEPGSRIAAGPKRPLSQSELLAAALDGSLEQMLDWREVAAGDFIYSPAGTIHAMGPGLSLIEIQQNLDVTYRLFDYGRARPLHLADALAIADRHPFKGAVGQAAPGLLVLGPRFVVELWHVGCHSVAAGEEGWLVPVAGTGAVDGQTIQPGQCWHVSGGSVVELDQGGSVLFAYAGASLRGSSGVQEPSLYMARSV